MSFREDFKQCITDLQRTQIKDQMDISTVEYCTLIHLHPSYIERLKQKKQ